MRQATVTVDGGHRVFYPRNHIFGLHGPVHHDNAGDHVVFCIASRFTQTRHGAKRNSGHIADQHGQTVLLREHDIADILNVAHQTQAADIHRLLAHTDGTSADIGVGIANRGKYLLQRQTIAFQLLRVHLNVVFLGGTAPGHNLSHARYGQQAALDDPVLDTAQVGEAVGRRSLDLVTQNFTDQAGRLNLWLHVVRQGDVLLQVDGGLRQRRHVVNAVLESHPHKGQSIKRGGADVVNAQRGRQTNLHGARVVTLHLFCRQPWHLRRDFKNHRCRIGVSLHIKFVEGQNASSHEGQQAEQNNGAARKYESE